MPKQISNDEAKNLVETIKTSMIRHECRDCECLQGVLVQIEINAEKDVTDWAGQLKVPPARMHSCLGCDPCPFAEIFTDISCVKK